MYSGYRWRFKDARLVVLVITQLKKALFDEAHHFKYTVHPGATKMCKDLKRNFWWKNMQREVAEYVTQCYTTQQVKAEHQRPAGSL